MSTTKFISSINHANLKEFKKAFKSNVNNKDKNGNTALMLIIHKIKSPTCTKNNKEKYYRIIDFVLENDEFDINAKDKQGNTALHLAVLSQDETVVKNLYKSRNLDPNIQNKDKQTALELAKNSDNPNIIKIIQKFYAQYKNSKNADADVICKLPDDNNNMSLQDSGSNLNKVQTATSRTKDINERNNLGQTLLHQAVLKNNFKSMQQLLKQKADPNISDNNGDTVLLIIMKYGNKYQTFEVAFRR